MSTVRGFVALTSVLLLALLTAVYAVAGSETAILALYDFERLINRSQAKADANICLVAATMYGANGYSLSEPHSLRLSDSAACSIDYIRQSNDVTEVRVRGGRADTFVEFERAFPRGVN